MRLYLDASAIIYALEGGRTLRQQVLDSIEEAERAVGGTVSTSRLSRVECRAKPLHDSNADLLTLYDQFLGHIDFLDIAASVIERAAQLRAFQNFRTPDAIHLASAIDWKADLFLTGDLGLRRCPGLEVKTLQA